MEDGWGERGTRERGTREREREGEGWRQGRREGIRDRERNSVNTCICIITNASHMCTLKMCTSCTCTCTFSCTCAYYTPFTEHPVTECEKHTMGDFHFQHLGLCDIWLFAAKGVVNHVLYMYSTCTYRGTCIHVLLRTYQLNWWMAVYVEGILSNYM